MGNWKALTLLLAVTPIVVKAEEVSPTWRSRLQQASKSVGDWSYAHAPSLKVPSQSYLWTWVPTAPNLPTFIRQPTAPSLPSVVSWVQQHYPSEKIAAFQGSAVANARWVLQNAPEGADYIFSSALVGTSMIGCTKIFSIKRCRKVAPIVAMFLIKKSYATIGYKQSDQTLMRAQRAGLALADGSIQDAAFDWALAAMDDKAWASATRKR